MRVYTDIRLEHFINEQLDVLKTKGVVNCRFCKKDLDAFLAKKDNKICGIYGLKRTGKTTLVYQTIRGLNINDVAFIHCSNKDDYIGIEQAIDSLNQKYIFIDEITKVEDFVSLSASLADCYPDKKIVITGTDSATMLFSNETELYNRMSMIHTTYISYSEYKYLLNKSLEEYIKYGGTLTDGETIYKDEESLEEYTNTAIVSNICKSVRNAKNDTAYRRLYDLYLNGSLESAINKTIELNAREFTLGVMTGEFNKSHRFGSAKQLVLKNRESLAQSDIDILRKWKDHSEICEYIMQQINIGESTDVKESDITLITNFLLKLDVLSKLPNEQLVFTQPGMQYCFAETLIDGIVNTREYQLMYPNTQRIMLEKIEQDTIGIMLEHLIYKDVLRCPKLSNYEIGRLENVGNGEFDLYILDKETKQAAVYEIKRNFTVSEQQYQYLINDDFCNSFERVFDCKIISKTVIYQGETQILDNGINYYNAEEFLDNVERISDMFRDDGIPIKVCDNEVVNKGKGIHNRIELAKQESNSDKLKNQGAQKEISRSLGDGVPN